MEYKKCSKCGKEFPATLEYFPKDKSSPSGLRADCKSCEYKRTSKWKTMKREQVKEEKRKAFIKKIQEHFSNYTYISHDDRNVIIECNKCKEHIKLSRSWANNLIRNKKDIRCKNCINKSKAKEKEMSYVCKQCGRTFIRTHGLQRYCSDKCRRRHKPMDNEKERYTKARINGKYDWSITLDKLIKRDKYTCKICGKPINMNDYTINNNGVFIAGNNYPSIDHIKPLSKGGTHTWDNVQLAHRRCNSIKQDKDTYITEHNQIKFSL